MRIPQKTVLLAACTMLAGLLCASGLSTDLIEAVANRAAESLARTQEAKVFKVDTQGRLVATDPQGREPTDVLATPTNTGDTLTPLHLDKQADRVYYKVSWNGGERVESRGLYGEDLKTLVSLANQSLYSAAHNKLYWTRDDAVRSMNLDGTGHTIVAKQTGHNTNDLTGWAWLGIYPWAYDQGHQDWHWLQDESWVLRQPTAQWHQGLAAAGINGWTWWGAYPWVYVNGYASWVYVRGDIWTYSNKNANWDLLENTTASEFDGKPTALTLDQASNALYFQLDPPKDTRRAFGTIQKLDLGTGALTTAIDMTRATHIEVQTANDRIYWAEADGLHTAKLSDTNNRAHIITTAKAGEAAPVVYKEPVPATPGDLYNLVLTPHKTDILNQELQLKHSTAKFNLGIGKDFVAGYYTWFRKAANRQAVLTLTSDQPVGASDPEGNRYEGWTVEEILTSSLGAKDLPSRINLTLTYRDNHTGTYVATRYLASKKVETVQGDFTGLIGDFTGVPFPAIAPTHLEAQTVTTLTTGSHGHLRATLRDDTWSKTQTLRIDPATQQATQE